MNPYILTTSVDGGESAGSRPLVLTMREDPRVTRNDCEAESVPNLVWGKLNRKRFYFSGALAKFRKGIISFVMSVSLSVCLPACLSVCLLACLPVCLSLRLHLTTRFPMGRFSPNLIFEYFSKICRKKFKFHYNLTTTTTTTTTTTVLHMNTHVHS